MLCIIYKLLPIYLLNFSFNFLLRSVQHKQSRRLWKYLTQIRQLCTFLTDLSSWLFAEVYSRNLITLIPSSKPDEGQLRIQYFRWHNLNDSLGLINDKFLKAFPEYCLHRKLQCSFLRSYLSLKIFPFFTARIAVSLKTSLTVSHVVVAVDVLSENHLCLFFWRFALDFLCRLFSISKNHLQT